MNFEWVEKMIRLNLSVALVLASWFLAYPGRAAEYSRKHVILDLMTMQQPGAPSGTMDSIIGYILPEIFESKEDCESALIHSYAGDIWKIEKTENEHRKGQLRLHQYWGEEPYMVRFCTPYLVP